MESKCWNFASLQCSIDFIANMELIFLQSLLKICVMRFCNCLIDLLYIYFFSLYSVSPLLSMTFICCCNPGLTIVLSVTHYGMPYWPPGAHKNPFPYLVTIVRSLFFVVVFFFYKSGALLLYAKNMYNCFVANMNTASRYSPLCAMWGARTSVKPLYGFLSVPPNILDVEINWIELNLMIDLGRRYFSQCCQQVASRRISA